MMNNASFYKEHVRQELTGRGAPKPQEYVDRLAEKIRIDNRHWESVLEYGCNDPFWPDGTNLELIQSHIIYHRFCIRAACEMYGLPLPAEYYLPVPPDVDPNYMATGIIPEEVVKKGTEKEQFEWSSRLERRERFAKELGTTHKKPPTLGEIQLTFI